MTKDGPRTERIVALLRQACVGYGAGGRPEDRNLADSRPMSAGILAAISMARGKRIRDVRMESVHSATVGAAGIQESQSSL